MKIFNKYIFEVSIFFIIVIYIFNIFIFPIFDGKRFIKINSNNKEKIEQMLEENNLPFEELKRIGYKQVLGEWILYFDYVDGSSNEMILDDSEANDLYSHLKYYGKFKYNFIIKIALYLLLTYVIIYIIYRILTYAKNNSKMSVVFGITIFCSILAIVCISIINVENEELKEIFEQYSSINVFLRSDVTENEIENFKKELEKMDIFKEIKYYPIGDASSIISGITSTQPKFCLTCYYPSKINKIRKFDEYGYFENIKHNLKQYDVVDNTSSVEMLDLYHKEGMTAIRDLIKKFK